MSFVSYAQNFEDVMLWRALKHVRNGFYIDVGANDPTIDSVTKSFYDQGWAGINIEPLISHHAALQQERPRDINLQCAAGEICGEIELWECDIRGWATADKSVIALHEENGHVGVFHNVPVLPLSEICNANVKGEIHFLKIDVEGFEKAVLEGMDFSQFRPWVLVVEATRPNSTEEVYNEWENIVLSSNYLLAYADGLNRFYVASEHSELLGTLRYPPNVFDEYMRVEQLTAALCTQQAEAKAEQAATKLTERKQEIDELQVSLTERATQQQALDASLRDTETQRQQLETQVQRIQDEAVQRDEKLREKDESNNWLNNEWNAANQKVEELHQSNHHWWSIADQQSKELEERQAKIDELHQSNHHWWCVAAQQSHELKSVYASKSWRITKPLRLVWQGISILINVLLYIPKALIRIIWNGVKWPFKCLLSILMRFILKRPKLKARAKATLINHPRLQAHLQRFAIFRNIVSARVLVAMAPMPEHSIVAAVLNTNKALSPHDLSNFTDKSITDIEYFDIKIAQRITHYYELGFNFDLITKIRAGHKIDYAEHSGDKLQGTVIHVFLALLFREASKEDVQHYSSMIIKSRSFEPLINRIMNSPEFELRGLKELTES